ncbi:hypothetical protein [Salinibacter sp.]|uniref:hypothetical protein n=1 Tax=Salinibacter sp. TaxID=2065818 RepID=UPI0021E7FAD2|nr:hypothetical protein [Salinibacter sp.]
MKIHALCLALNEEIFIEDQLKTLYPLCSGISILSQYDRDWYGKRVEPDDTINQVLEFPDPEGKIHCVVRRWRDQAAALNMEMEALSSEPHSGIDSHGSSMEEIKKLHDTPDYFLIVDADEFYDPDTFDDIVNYLAARRPRAMRVKGLMYKGSWNRRVPEDEVDFCQFGFVRPGVLFESVRQITWNEHRLSKLLRWLRLPDFSSRIFGFITCPKEVGVFHHGCWLGDRERLAKKHSKSAHQWADDEEYTDSVLEKPVEYVPTSKLPCNIREGDWPEGYLEEEPPQKVS